MIIRPERADDAAALRTLLIAAFGRAAEADLVERLRREGDLALALVAEDADAVCGFVAFPKLILENGGTTHDVVGLAPAAVAQDRQRSGIGTALIRAGHRILGEQGYCLVFVLGDPTYYNRFGYDSAEGSRFKSTYAGPHFMALRLNPSAPQSGAVRYPAAFDHLG